MVVAVQVRQEVQQVVQVPAQDQHMLVVQVARAVRQLELVALVVRSLLQVPLVLVQLVRVVQAAVVVLQDLTDQQEQLDLLVLVDQADLQAPQAPL
jgi:hypothetical protein